MVTIKKNPSSRSTDTCPFCGAGVFLKHHHDNPMHDVLGIDLKNEYIPIKYAIQMHYYSSRDPSDRELIAYTPSR